MQGCRVKPIIHSATSIWKYNIYNTYFAHNMTLNHSRPTAVRILLLTARVVGLEQWNQTERSSNGLKCPTQTTNGPRFQIVLSTLCWQDTQMRTSGWSDWSDIIWRPIYFPGSGEIITLSIASRTTLSHEQSIIFQSVVLLYPCKYYGE